MDLDKAKGRRLPRSHDAAHRTGERILEKRPETHAAVIEGLKKGDGIYQIARREKVKAHTVAAIRDNNPDKITESEWREQVKNKLRNVVTKTADRMVEEIDLIPIGVLHIVNAVAIDQINKLDNKPVAIIRHESAQSHEQLRERLDALEAEVIEAIDVKKLDN